MTLIAGHHPKSGMLKFTQPQQVSKIEPELGTAQPKLFTSHLNIDHYLNTCYCTAVAKYPVSVELRRQNITMSEAFLIFQFTPV